MILESKFIFFFCCIVRLAIRSESRKIWPSLRTMFVNRGRLRFMQPLFSIVDNLVRNLPKFVNILTKNVFTERFAIVWTLLEEESQGKASMHSFHRFQRAILPRNDGVLSTIRKTGCTNSFRFLLEINDKILMQGLFKKQSFRRSRGEHDIPNGWDEFTL